MTCAISIIMTETVTIPKEEYVRLKYRAEAEEGVLEQLIQSLEDIKCGRVTRVR